MRRLLALALLALSACAAPTASPPPTADLGLRPITAAPTRPPTATALLRSPTPTASPTPTPHTTALPPYRAGTGAFVRVAGGALQLNGERFTVRGLTLARDLWATDALPTLEADFARLRRLGANTVRLTLRNDALFAQGAPVQTAFARLDAVLRLASAYGLRVILTLCEDDGASPLPPPDAMALLAARYRQEPALLMWDLCDVDAQALYARLSRDAALLWLAETAAAFRLADPVHPLTASWRGDAAGTLASVDVVAVQLEGSAENLRRQVAALRQLSPKPILLSAFSGQGAEALGAVVRAAEGDRLAGWLLEGFAPQSPALLTLFPRPAHP